MPPNCRQFNFVYRLWQKHLEVGSVALRLSWHCQPDCTQMFTAVPAFGIIKAMQLNYIYYHHTIAFKSLRLHIGNAWAVSGIRLTSD